VALRSAEALDGGALVGGEVSGGMEIDSIRLRDELLHGGLDGDGADHLEDGGFDVGSVLRRVRPASSRIRPAVRATSASSSAGLSGRVALATREVLW